MPDLIILAMGPSRAQCPYDAETWGVNNGYKQIAGAKGRLDKLFLAHTQVKDKDGDDVFNWEEINNLGVEVINTHRVKGLKSKLFPMKRIVDKFGSDFFTDSICYMLAYAIDRVTLKTKDGYKLKRPYHIAMYGADMLTQDEYQTEKGGIEYWIGFARGIGIKVDISKGSAVCRTITGKTYGTKVKVDHNQELLESYCEAFVSTSPVKEVRTGVLEGDLLQTILEGGMKCPNLRVSSA